MLATHEMAEINEYFYDLLEEQADGSGELDRHPYEVDWTKYDQLHRLIGKGVIHDGKLPCSQKIYSTSPWIQGLENDF